jgi:hypothetical protein
MDDTPIRVRGRFKKRNSDGFENGYCIFWLNFIETNGIKRELEPVMVEVDAITKEFLLRDVRKLYFKKPS